MADNAKTEKMSAPKKDKGRFFKKIIVTLKYRTHIVPILLLVIGFVVFSLMLTDVSNTTLFIGYSNMGLYIFISYLTSILAFVALSRTFPKREKVKLFFLILSFVLLAVVIFVDVLYLGLINTKIESLGPGGFEALEAKRQAHISNARTAVMINIIFDAIVMVLLALLPVIRKLLMKINTRVVFDENANISSIDLSEGDEAEAKRSGGMRATK